MMKSIIYIAALALGGCSTIIIPNPDNMYEWKQVRDPLPYTTHIVPQAAVEAYCAHSKSKAYGCAVWDHEQCWIFASSAWNLKMTLPHEIEHCEGKDHQNV